MFFDDCEQKLFFVRKNKRHPETSQKFGRLVSGWLKKIHIQSHDVLLINFGMFLNY